MSGGGGSGDEGDGTRGPNRQALSDVLASIRALVSAETSARIHEQDEVEEDVLMLTEDMRVDTRAEFERSIGGIERGGARLAAGAPIHDEEALRGLVSEILREELRGEFGERISRDLRKIVRREVDDAFRAERRGDQPGA